MQPIEGKIFSNYQRDELKVKVTRKDGPGVSFLYDYELEKVWAKDATVNRIRASEGYKVASFRQLMDEVATVTINNKSFEMFYRGQTIDFKNNKNRRYRDNVPKTVIYPSICRPDKNSDGSYKLAIRRNQIEKRYEDLYKSIELYRGNQRSYFNEYYFALFQHYEVMPTPLIDITQSLRVAATFALKGTSTGYLYMFGLPYPNQSISYYSDLGFVLIKLQNVVPVEAKRPRYQEGYLVGKYPVLPTKTHEDNLANRMVAKFLLDNTQADFWDNYFQPMPDEILFPENDEVEKDMLKIKKVIENKPCR